MNAKDIAGLEGWIVGLVLKIAGLELMIAGLEGLIVGLTLKVSGLELKIAGLELVIAGLESKIVGLELVIAGLECWFFNGCFDGQNGVISGASKKNPFLCVIEVCLKTVGESIDPCVV